jgi:DNA-binding CsgD family transcriptional regulator
LSAIVIPAGPPGRFGGAEVPVLLVVTDPCARVEPPAAILARVYGLTAAEARVALLLGRGLVPKEIAAELGTTWNTVRFQLRQVYAKTQTTGQSALVRLLMLLGVVGDDGRSPTTTA